MNNSFCIILCGLACWMMSGCGTKPCSNKEKYLSVLKHFEHDSLKYKAAKFIIDNLADHHAVVTRYQNSGGEDISTVMALYDGAMPEQFADSMHLEMYTDIIYDSVAVSPQFLIKDIENAFAHYHSNVLKRQMPFDIFCEYILPYRVGIEEVNNWREYFNGRYTRYLSSFDPKPLTDSPFFANLSIERKLWYDKLYNYHFKLSTNQTVNDILAVKTPYTCEDYAVFLLYLFRSLGIPAAYEYIPLYGKFNFGHVHTTFLHQNGRFYPAPDSTMFKYQIAKMYRRTFSRQSNPFEEIRMAGENIENIPSYFNYDHALDITNERTDASDIRVMATESKSRKVGYLCVYNQGEWKPVEWAQYDKTNKSYSFKNMGRKILYQLANCENNHMQLIDAPFVLDTLGDITYLNSARQKKVTAIKKFDRHKEIIPQKEYILYCWNSETHNWQELQRKTAANDFIPLNVVANTLYKITEIGYESDLVRPFTVANNNQKWW